MALENEKTALKKLLIEKSVKIGEFTLSSGKKSNFYIDCRKVTLHPDGAKLIGKIILEKIRGLGVDAVGGLTMGADPIVGAVITLGNIPGFLVRKAAKEHGTQQKIEGHLQPGWNVLIVEDVATTGASTLNAIAAAEAAGAKVVKVIALVDREEGSAEALKNYVFEPLFKKSEFLA